MVRSLGWSLAGAMVVGLVGAPALATVVIQPSLEQLTARSQVIVHAVVEDQAVVRGEGGRILTLSRLRVKDGIKGAAAGGSVTLYQVGGTLDGQVAKIAGVSSFRVGEEVIVFGETFLATDTIRFLQDNAKDRVDSGTLTPSHGWMVPYGIGLGKFAVDRTGAVPMANEELGDVSVAVQGPSGVQVGGRAVLTRQPLNVFVSEVRRMASAGRTR